MNPDAVRPGTSDALTARTIDATIYPPLVRAQETAASLVPRFAHAAAPFASPLFLGALALTLVFGWVAIRMRYRPMAIVLGTLLVMTLTSFNPVQKPEQSQPAIVQTPRTRINVRPYRDYTPPPQVEAPEPPEAPEAPDVGGDNTIKTYKFVATSPPMPEANRNAQPIEAEIRVDSLSPDIKTIRIVSSTNEVSAPIAQ